MHCGETDPLPALKAQLGARLGIASADVEAYEHGEKRMGCKLLLETAKQLKATPRFFFQ